MAKQFACLLFISQTHQWSHTTIIKNIHQMSSYWAHPWTHVITNCQRILNSYGTGDWHGSLTMCRWSCLPGFCSVRSKLLQDKVDLIASHNVIFIWSPVSLEECVITITRSKFIPCLEDQILKIKSGEQPSNSHANAG